MKNLLLVAVVLLASVVAHAGCAAKGTLHLVGASSAVWCPAQGPIEWLVTYDASRDHLVVVHSSTNSWLYFPLTVRTTYEDTFSVNGKKAAFTLKTGNMEDEYWIPVSLVGK